MTADGIMSVVRSENLKNLLENPSSKLHRQYLSIQEIQRKKIYR